MSVPTGVLPAHRLSVVITALLLMCGSEAAAQPVPQPDLSFIVVENAHGKPLRGTFVESHMMAELRQQQHRRPWTVRKQFKVSEDYPYGPEKPGDLVQWLMTGEPIRVGLHHHLRFSVIDCFCTELCVEVARDGQYMRIEMPATAPERWALVRAMQARSGDWSTPEVFVFRTGRFSYAELANEPMLDRLEARIARKLRP